MSVEKLYRLRDMLCKELDEIADTGKLSQTNVQMADTLLHAVKNLDKVVMVEEGGSSYDGSYESYGSYDDGGGSYRRGRSRTTGRYVSRDSGDMSRNSYEGSYRSSRGGYSRAEDKERMAADIRKMMKSAGGEGDRRVLQECLELVDSM